MKKVQKLHKEGSSGIAKFYYDEQETEANSKKGCHLKSISRYIELVQSQSSWKA